MVYRMKIQAELSVVNSCKMFLKPAGVGRHDKRFGFVPRMGTAAAGVGELMVFGADHGLETRGELPELGYATRGRQTIDG